MHGRIQFTRLFSFLASLIVCSGPAAAGETWGGGHGSADAACRERIGNSESAYAYKRAEVNGNVAYCYVKIKEGEGDEIHDASVTKDEPAPEAEEEKKEEASGAAQGGPGEPGGKGGKEPKVDSFPFVCHKNYFGSDFEQELNDAYKTTHAGTGGAGAGLFTGGNAAVLEWKEKGVRKRQWFTSGDGHSEQHILAYITEKKIPKEAVTRILSELSPCVERCYPALHKHFEGVRKNVKLEFFWIHDKDTHKDCKLKDAAYKRLEEKNNRRKKLFP